MVHYKVTCKLRNNQRFYQTKIKNIYLKITTELRDFIQLIRVSLYIVSV